MRIAWISAGIVKHVVALNQVTWWREEGLRACPKDIVGIARSHTSRLELPFQFGYIVAPSLLVLLKHRQLVSVAHQVELVLSQHQGHTRRH